MTRIDELNKAQSIDLSSDFYDLIKMGVIFNPTRSTDKLYYDKMSCDIVIQNYNHSKFLKMLFQSIEQADRKNIDVKIIITDGGSNQLNKDLVYKLMNEFKDRLNIIYLYHNLSEKRKEFNEKNSDGTFHSFPYIANSAIYNACSNDIYVHCDSSNIVNKDYVRGLLSMHYIAYKSNMIIKARGADFTAESTLFLEDKDYNEKWFELAKNYYHFDAGRGFGFSVKLDVLKELGGFNQILSCCGAVDDEFIYKFKLKYSDKNFIGSENAFGCHIIHSSGYKVEEGDKPRLPNWGYKTLKEIVKQEEFNKEQMVIVPEFIEKNF